MMYFAMFGQTFIDKDLACINDEIKDEIYPPPMLCPSLTNDENAIKSRFLPAFEKF